MTGHQFESLSREGSYLLLAKLEERFILGEISEEAYNQLVEKYCKEE